MRGKHAPEGERWPAWQAGTNRGQGQTQGAQLIPLADQCVLFLLHGASRVLPSMLPGSHSAAKGGTHIVLCTI